MKTVLTIAGSDSIGGAGIQADIKTMTMNGVYAMSAITALTAQNTVGVEGIISTTPFFLALQLDEVFTDIVPDAVKIGMVSTAELVDVISESLVDYNAKNVVIDPVMVASTGAKLIDTDAESALINKLLPVAKLVTPNALEAELISGMPVKSEEDMLKAAQFIGDNLGVSVLLKGGHMVNSANDLLYENGDIEWFYGDMIDNPNTHGTGCTLSSAIASNLAKGYNLKDSVRRGKEYVAGALKAMLKLGRGIGPLQHNYTLTGKFAEEAE